MTKDTDMREQDLEDIFAQARDQAPLDSGPVLARVIADAVRHQSRPGGRNLPTLRPRKSGIWARLAMAVGGRGVLAGLATIALAGVMVGYEQPTSLSALTEPIFVQTTVDEVDLFPGVDEYLIEG